MAVTGTDAIASTPIVGGDAAARLRVDRDYAAGGRPRPNAESASSSAHNRSSIGADSAICSIITASSSSGRRLGSDHVGEATRLSLVAAAWSETFEGMRPSPDSDRVCRYCGMISSSRFEHIKHVSQTHLQCPLPNCEHMAPTASRLQVHMASHCMELFKCPICSEAYGSQQLLNAHVSLHKQRRSRRHGVTGPDDRRQSVIDLAQGFLVDGDLVCPLCATVHSTTFELRAHIQKHHAREFRSSSPARPVAAPTPARPASPARSQSPSPAPSLARPVSAAPSQHPPPASPSPGAHSGRRGAPCGRSVNVGDTENASSSQVSQPLQFASPSNGLRGGRGQRSAQGRGAHMPVSSPSSVVQHSTLHRDHTPNFIDDIWDDADALVAARRGARDAQRRGSGRGAHLTRRGSSAAELNRGGHRGAVYPVVSPSSESVPVTKPKPKRKMVPPGLVVDGDDEKVTSGQHGADAAGVPAGGDDDGLPQVSDIALPHDLSPLPPTPPAPASSTHGARPAPAPAPQSGGDDGGVSACGDGVSGAILPFTRGNQQAPFALGEHPSSGSRPKQGEAESADSRERGQAGAPGRALRGVAAGGIQDAAASATEAVRDSMSPPYGTSNASHLSTRVPWQLVASINDQPRAREPHVSAPTPSAPKVLPAKGSSSGPALRPTLQPTSMPPPPPPPPAKVAQNGPSPAQPKSSASLSSTKKSSDSPFPFPWWDLVKPPPPEDDVEPATSSSSGEAPTK